MYSSPSSAQEKQNCFSQDMRTVSVCPKTGLRRGSWTAEEDQLLSSYIQRYGHWNWRELPKHAGLSRCGKSCRLRWLNYLRPNIKRGHFTKEEDDIILNYVENHGNRWSVIAAKLQGRTDNEIKNHWHTHLEKCGKNSAVSKGAKRKHVKAEKPVRKENVILPNSNIQILESCPITSVCPSESDTVIIENSGMKNGSKVSSDTFMEFDESFWNELFFVEDDYMQKTATFDNLLVPSFSNPIESCDLWSFI